MLLKEFAGLAPDTGDVTDSQAARQEMERNEKPAVVSKEKKDAIVNPDKNSNVAKAKKIRNLARMKARSTDADNEDTPHQAHLGGHSSSFLNKGPHG